MIVTKWVELTCVTHRVNEVAGQQDKTATRDVWATGGVFYFGSFPASEQRSKEELKAMGEYEALDQAAVAKNCQRNGAPYRP